MKKLLLALFLIGACLVSIVAIGDPLSTTTSNVINSPMSDDGYSIGRNSEDKVSFYGETPVAQASGGSGYGSGAGVFKYLFPCDLVTVTTEQDLITGFIPGYNFTILSVDFVTDVAVTTSSKLFNIYTEIGTTNITGGVVALTSAAATPKGKIVADTAITALNTGDSTSAISVKASDVTAFSEGSGAVMLTIQNNDLDALMDAAADMGIISVP